MNYAELQDRVKFMLDFNDGQTDQDFSATRIKQAINHAYQREVVRGQHVGQRRYFKKFKDLTWTAGAITFTLPVEIRRKQIYNIEDITDTQAGGSIIRQVHFKDNKTLQWGTQGPSSERTLRFYYFAEPETLLADIDEPELIPDILHELICWSAAIYLRELADEEAPEAWLREHMELRMDYYKWLSHAHPVGDQTPGLWEDDLQATAEDAFFDGSTIGGY